MLGRFVSAGVKADAKEHLDLQAIPFQLSDYLKHRKKYDMLILYEDLVKKSDSCKTEPQPKHLSHMYAYRYLTQRASAKNCSSLSGSRVPTYPPLSQ